MMKYFLKNLLITLLILCFLTPAFAAEQAASAEGGAEDSGSDELVNQTIGDLAIIVGAGAGGAILGLSTLSFYEKPKEHWKNITVGGALGVIAGVAVVVYLQATRNQTIVEEEEEASLKAAPDFDYFARKNWHQEVVASLKTTESTPFTFTHSF